MEYFLDETLPSHQSLLCSAGVICSDAGKHSKQLELDGTIAPCLEAPEIANFPELVSEELFLFLLKLVGHGHSGVNKERTGLQHKISRQ